MHAHRQMLLGQEENLHYSTFFQDVPIESVLDLLESCPIRQCKAGEVLIRAGQPNHNLFVILRGQLRVHLKLTLEPVATLVKGDVVGELSLIDGQPASAHVVAGGECSLLVLDEQTVRSLLGSTPRVAQNLISILAQRLRAGNSMILKAQGVERDHQRYAVLDPLTGFYNSRWLEAILPNLIERWKTDRSIVTLLLFRIDDLHSYEQTFGRLAAERAVYTVGWLLRKSMRPADLVARHREDQFAVVLPSLDLAAGLRVAERVRDAVNREKICTLNRETFPPVSVSVGVARITGSCSAEGMLESTSEALETARKKGGNCVCMLENGQIVPQPEPRIHTSHRIVFRKENPETLRRRRETLRNELRFLETIPKESQALVERESTLKREIAGIDEQLNEIGFH